MDAGIACRATHSLSINNLTHVGRFQDDKNEYELCDEINRFGYDKLVAGTGLEFLDTDITESFHDRLNSSSPETNTKNSK